MSFIDEVKQRSKKDIKTIVLPEAEDIRILEATEQVIKEGSILGNVMMDAPKMTPKMRQDFLRYADEFIFGSGDVSNAEVKLARVNLNQGYHKL